MQRGLTFASIFDIINPVHELPALLVSAALSPGIFSKHNASVLCFINPKCDFPFSGLMCFASKITPNTLVGLDANRSQLQTN